MLQTYLIFIAIITLQSSLAKQYGSTLKESDTLLRPHPKAIEAQESESRRADETPQTPPVRVIVSYPRDEEGKRVYFRFRPSRRTWIWIGSCGLLFIIASIVGGYFIFRTEDDKPKLDSGQPPTPPVGPIYEKPIERNLDKYVTNLVKQRYQELIQQGNRTFLRKFFKEEWERLKFQELDEFLVYLGPKFPLNLPLTEDNRLDVVENIREEIIGIQKWLSFVDREQQELSGYYFQKNKSETQHKFKNEGKWKGKQLEILKDLWNDYTSNMSVEVGGETIIFSNTVLLLSDVVTTLKEIPHNISLVTMVATTVYIDCNFTQNVLLAIIAPQWNVIKKNVFIDLSGYSFTNNKATEADGAPGRPGGHGGLFLAIGDYQQGQITVKVNGGDGENGHDGEPGGNATARMMIPNKRNPDPKCVFAIKPTTYNLNNEEVAYLRVYPDESCAYKGGPGGTAGAGGRGGISIFITANGTRVNKGTDGKDGQAGKVGVDGKGLTGLCNYTAIRTRTMNTTQNQVWSIITKVVCIEDAQIPLLPSNAQLHKPYILISPHEISEFKKAINSFSKIARSRLYKGYPEMFTLLQVLEETPIIGDFTSVVELFNETEQISSDLSNYQVLNSFLNKVRVVLNQTSDPQEKQALRYLRAAVWSRSAALQYGYGDYYIVDIEKYVDQLLKSAEKTDIAISAAYNITQQQTVKDINEKLDEIYHIISKAIIPMLNKYKVTDNDAPIMALVIAMADATKELIQITRDHITHILPDLSKLRKIISDYEYTKERFMAPKLIANNEMTEEQTRLSCLELGIEVEQCLNSGTLFKWKIYVNMDRKILDSFFKLFETESITLDAVQDILWSIRAEVRSDLLENTIISAVADTLRETAGDLALLIHRSRHVLQDASFNESLVLLNDGFVFTNNNISKLVASLKSQIRNNQLRKEYQRVFATYQQWAFPYKDTVTEVPPTANQEELTLGLKAIKDAMTHFQTTITERDANLKRAEFQLGSTTGPFYTWPNEDLADVIKNLFLGKPILLRADIHRSLHVPGKQAIKFRTVELGFTGINETLLQNFAVEMTHMGFSKFYYNNEVYTAIQPSVRLYHSFAHGDHDYPEVYNNVYKKLKKGDITLSPYTTWIVELQQVNREASYAKLLPFVNSTSIHLVGTGWYTTDFNLNRHSTEN